MFIMCPSVNKAHRTEINITDGLKTAPCATDLLRWMMDGQCQQLPLAHTRKHTTKKRDGTLMISTCETVLLTDLMTAGKNCVSVHPAEIVTD